MRFIAHFDNISPGRDWGRFAVFQILCRVHPRLNPVLGASPDNRAPKLNVHAPPLTGRAQQIAANRSVVASQFDMNRIAQLYRATYEAFAPGLLGGRP